jgi:hypothetical protein
MVCGSEHSPSTMSKLVNDTSLFTRPQSLAFTCCGHRAAILPIADVSISCIARNASSWMLEPYCPSQLSTVWLTDRVGNFAVISSHGNGMSPSFGGYVSQTGKTKQMQVAQCAMRVSGQMTIRPYLKLALCLIQLFHAPVSISDLLVSMKTITIEPGPLAFS